ncbi:DUF6461 domain-containing protein [Streptosporangium sp. NPDC001559]|uniref:DUF6461 domain-containing protein n=1 Tax=Streptosporangium sp. NPDC001559 TaxID=3366187 RepID=UPI0036EABFA9
MESRTELYDLLFSYVRLYDDEQTPFQEFAAVWCEGIGVEETAKRLGADLESAEEHDLVSATDDIEIAEGYGVILAGLAGTWTLVVQVVGFDCVLDDALIRLSRDGSRALSLGWDIDGNEEIGYAVNGDVVTRLSVTCPELRSGADPTALDPLMEGLKFQLDEDNPVVEESVNSAFALAGRVTGRKIDRAWLDAPHTRFLIPRAH